MEHLTQNQVESYCRQKLGPAQLLAVSDHLGECETCRRRIESAMNADRAFLALRSELFSESAETFSPYPAGAHLSAEQTAEYIDGNLDGEQFQLVSDHLTICQQCLAAVEDLRAFSHQIEPTLEREYHPAQVDSPIDSPKKSLRDRIVDFLLAPFRGYARMAFGAALTVVLLAVTGWLVWPMLQEKEREHEAVVSPPAPTQPAPTQPAPAPPTQSEQAPVVARLNDGQGQLTLDQNGRLSGADDLPVAYQSMLRETLADQRIQPSPQLKGLFRPPSSLMSAEKQKSEFLVIEPVGKVLISDSPTFRWSPMAGATAYVVEIYDAKFNLVTSSPQLTANLWKAPQRLQRDEVYSWQVKAVKEGQEIIAPRPPLPQAKFRILGQAKANELAKAKRDYPSSHLTLGLLYAQAGLINEAEQELRALEKANPDSEIARSLLKQVRALRR